MKQLELETAKIILIHESLQTLGIFPNLYGYKYIVYAIELIISDYNYLYSLTKCLYVDVATKFNTSPGAVESSIRHAINLAWKSNNQKFLHIIFKTSSQKPLSNSKFLSLFVYYIIKTYIEEEDR